MRMELEITKHKDKLIKWGKSEAKRLLRDDIITGVVTAEMPAKDGHSMREEFQLCKCSNFSTNLGN